MTLIYAVNNVRIEYPIYTERIYLDSDLNCNLDRV